MKGTIKSNPVEHIITTKTYDVYADSENVDTIAGYYVSIDISDDVNKYGDVIGCSCYDLRTHVGIVAFFNGLIYGTVKSSGGWKIRVTFCK